MTLSKTLFLLPVASLVAVAAAFGSGACSSSATFTLPSGAADVTTTFGTCDDEGGYAIVTDDSLCAGSVTCSTDFYAICDGTVFSACTCGIPDTGTVIADPVFVSGDQGDAGDDADDSSNDDAGDGSTTSTDDAGDDGGATADAGTTGDEDGGASVDAGAGTAPDAG